MAFSTNKGPFDYLFPFVQFTVTTDYFYQCSANDKGSSRIFCHVGAGFEQGKFMFGLRGSASWSVVGMLSFFVVSGYKAGVR